MKGKNLRNLKKGPLVCVLSILSISYFSDNFDIVDAKKFFCDNYSHIYYIFYDNFGNVEADLKQRGKFILFRMSTVFLQCTVHIYTKYLQMLRFFFE